MKKGCSSIFLVIGGIVVLGLLLRFVQLATIEKKPQSAHVDKKNIMGGLAYEEEAKIRNLYGKALIESGKIAPSKEWLGIMPGKWDLLSVRYFKNTDSYWLIKGDVIFGKNQEANLTAKNIRGYKFLDTAESDAKMIAGGGLVGKWEASQSDAFIIKPDKCAFYTSYKHEGWYDFPGCPYFDFPIGNASDAGWNSEVKAFSRDTIITVVEDFRYNAKQYLYLTRIK